MFGSAGPAINLLLEYLWERAAKRLKRRRNPGWSGTDWPATIKDENRGEEEEPAQLFQFAVCSLGWLPLGIRDAKKSKTVLLLCGTNSLKQVRSTNELGDACGGR